MSEPQLTEIPALQWDDALPEQEYAAKHVSESLIRRLGDRWDIGSYSSLAHGQSGAERPFDWKLIDAESFVGDAGSEQSQEPSLQLPRGARFGTFLHSIFEEIDFAISGPKLREYLLQKLASEGMEPELCEPMAQMVEGVLHCPLQSGLSLAALPSEDRLVEMEFWLPVAELDARSLSQLCRRYDPLSREGEGLSFRQLKGMLKGFIDLTFRFEGRYYLLDYKSNYLGDEEEAYHPDRLGEAMLAHRYDLQYQLYALALHRMLKQRIADYDFERHFGGVYYLFARGMTPNHPELGVFHCRPCAELVEGLDALFAGAELGEV